ncbi:uncharacterized protein LOC134666884, partial [Cydia fagiglandana]|uniref:uncharacterized protein LOC134666884 n=1 Tax=Cydia fagiglandana TaxID=1458189 RepID=UPI002FEE3C75
KSKRSRSFETASLLIFLFHVFAHARGTQFASHVSVNTPAHSFRHGVGDPLPTRQGYRSSRHESYRLLRNLVYPDDIEKKTYKELVEVLDKHFKPKQCSFVEKAKFYGATRSPGETLGDWAARLRGLACYCEFGTALDMVLLDRFVLGLGMGHERDKLFEQDYKSLTFAKALEIAEKAECAREAKKVDTSGADVIVKQEPVFRVGSDGPPVRQMQQRGSGGGGYPRVMPRIPFDSEERRGDGVNSLSWPYDAQQETYIPVLPPSPYKVDSPDPESLWPEGLFLPPLGASRFGFGRRTDAEPEIVDPYLVEGSEAVAAVGRARQHGVYYFHDVPHIESLLANQELRALNRLQPHRVASIRHTWPYNRP